jgi:pyruvate/2-oxoglutarate dehydrogenase complex dihydrolipoamide acyltransferase (E2) component
MAVKVVAPRLGEGVTELTIVRWLKQESDQVQELEPLLEVETDKVVTEIPSPATGTLLKQVAAANSVTPVGSVIAWIGREGEPIPGSVMPPGSSEPQPEQREAVPSARPLPQKMEMGQKGRSTFISPVVAKIAGENHVDLNQVKGTGLGGRITKKDILDFLAGSPSQQDQGSLPAMHSAASVQPSAGDRVVPLSVIRKSIAERMLQSKQTSPHVLTAMEADMSRVTAHLNANKDLFARDGLKLTYTAYFIAAIVEGLRAYPLANSSWSEAGIVMHSAINIGMAVSLGEEGLIVPVIRDADRLSLSGLARAVNDLANRARARKLQPEEVRGGTFTLTNHGTSGSLFAMPIINQPQSGILGTGAIQKRPLVVTDADGNDAIAIRPMVYLSFVFDHRILDGAMADWFLSKVVKSLELWQ